MVFKKYCFSFEFNDENVIFLKMSWVLPSMIF